MVNTVLIPLRMLKISRVVTKNDWNTFIDLPFQIYKNDPHWVAPLRIAVRDMLDVNKNPFFQHARLIAFNALKDNQIVGRIIGVIDDNHNQFHNETTGFFGFFESIEDQAVANALLDHVVEWLKNQGITTLRGPMNPSTNHECALLVEGFDDPPAVMMTYNPPYYSELLEKWGLKKSKDLLAYQLSAEAKFSDLLMAQAEKLRHNLSVKFRTVNPKKFKEEVDLILDIYNDAWQKNWGFVPMNREEFQHMAKDLEMIYDPNLLLIIEVNNEPAGFALALPDVNQALHKIKNGKLLPFGLLKLIWFSKGPFKRKTVNRLRIITLGVRKKFQNTSLGALFYVEYLNRGRELGYQTGEASWILEDNRPMNKALERMCGKRYKVYRLYDRVL